MSFCDRSGQQLHPNDLAPGPALSWDDALTLARAIVRDERLPEGERLRLMWVAMDAADASGTLV